VYVALDVVRAAAPDELLVVGVGQSGVAAQTLGLGGRAAGIVLVDGLGGPWLGPDGLDAERRRVLRQILTTPEALAEPPPGADDPRATMVTGAADRRFAVRQAEAMPVPVLLVETPSSPTPDTDELAHHFARATVARLDSRDPALVAAAVRSWWTDRPDRKL
jgi:hypothetical protein